MLNKINYMSNNVLKNGLLLVCSTILLVGYSAEIKNFDPNRGKDNQQKKKTEYIELANNCRAASQSADLDINNVRTRILNGGDMWWDLNNPKYEIPKVSDANSVRKHSLFAGALWIGGLGKGDGNLRMAAMTYRQRGNDFWPGTLDINTVSTDAGRCESWDKMFKVSREELLRQEKSGFQDLSKGILEWPAFGNPNTPIASGQTTDLAPFFDVDGVPGYNPYSGDYPILDPTREAAKNLRDNQPDQMIWFAYNDRGNIHSETGGIPVGIEIQTTAFAFQTNDEVNNMTFYRSKIVNRGFEALEKTYFGQWVDADLGNYADDYVGCDVNRSLGYCYNGDDNDEGVLGYGLNPPSIGVDFFEGPLDENGNELGMGVFMYYDNNFNPINGNPTNAIDFYNFLQGRWMNGNRMKFGGNGVNGTVETNYMFDNCTNPATATLPCWTEQTAGNQPADRRFLQSAGPFTLLPGAVNYVTVGVVWARANSGGAAGSISSLKLASDKAQKLFNNKFNLINGPTPPVTEVQELNNELVVKLINAEITEAYSEDVKNELNQLIVYKFQGYLLYQLKDGTVSNNELNNVEKARLIAQCDIKDEITTMINKDYDADVSALIPKLMVDGANKGVQRTFSVKSDAFAAGSNKNLVNFRTYYYLLMPYGFPSNDPNKNEPIQFLPSRTPIRFSAYPRNTMPEQGGSDQQSNYGDGPILRQISGQGNGGNILEFSKETIDAILNSSTRKIDQPVYLGGNGPVKIKIVDPLLVPNANFEFRFLELTADRVSPLGSGANRWQDNISVNSYWMLTNLTNNEVVYSEGTIEKLIETVQGRESLNGPTKRLQSLRDWGLAVEVQQPPSPGKNQYGDPTNGFLNYSVVFKDNNKIWLTALFDNDLDNSPLNWIRSGTKFTGTFDAYSDDFNGELDPLRNGLESYDPNQAYEKIWNGRIAPYALTARAIGPKPSGTGRGTVLYSPAFNQNAVQDNPMSELASVKIVLTPDVRKWSKTIVIELAEDVALSEGGAPKFGLRAATSKRPIYNNSDGSFIRWEEVPGETGTSYFPGYAINLETGERLNIVFGEDSYVPNDNGRDMIWNPTSDFGSSNYLSFGGKHFFYVMGSYQGMVSRVYRGPIYDEGNAYKALLATGVAGDRRRVFSQAMWTVPAMTANGFSITNGVPPTEVEISIHVRKPYTKKYEDYGDSTKAPIYTFSTEKVFNNVNEQTGKKSVNLIGVVPNPYYAYSGYESSAVENKIKIINLPPKADISIYTLNGALVRRIKKDDNETFVDWDLKNTNRVPIASGFYIIHVDCGNLGEKILKWYGVMRQLDLDTY